MAAACDNCPYEHRITVLEEANQHNSVTHRDFYERFEASKVNDAKTEMRFEQIMQSLRALEKMVGESNAKVNKKIDELRIAPAKKWNNLVWLVISAIVGAMITMFIKPLVGG